MSIVRNDLQIIHPLEGGFSVTPSDVNDLPRKTTGIMVGESGDLRVMMANGNIVTWVAVAAGIIHPIQTIRVYSTGTTATGIVGGY